MKCLRNSPWIVIFLFTNSFLWAQSATIEGHFVGFPENTLPVYNIATDQLIGQIAMQPDGTFQQKIQVKAPMEVRIGEKNGCSAILLPGKIVRLTFDTVNQKLTPDHIEDHLHHDLHASFNAFLADKSSLLFGSGTHHQVWQAVDSFRITRAKRIDNSKSQLALEAYEILQHRNAATLHAFAVSYGRMLKLIPPTHHYFDFIEQMHPSDTMFRYSPIAMLWKFEIAYLRQHGKIEQVTDFIDYIENQVTITDLAHFYKSIYLKERLDHPVYWRQHPSLNAEILGELEIRFATEKNPYQQLYYNNATIFYQTLRGQAAPDFSALDAAENAVKLSDFWGKTVVIDSWATWCGPCLDQKPILLETLAEIAPGDKFQLLFVSFDENKKAWEKFIANDPIPDFAKHIHLEKGFRSAFATQLSINAIPRYIIIDAEGNFFNAEAPSPGQELQKQVQQALSQ